MKKFAVIDIGSNSVRLMIVADGKVLYKTLNTTRLGEGIAHTSTLNVAAIERTANAVASFYQKAKQEGAESIYAFATAAVRSAVNGQDFVCTVRKLCDLEVEIVSGEEEALLGITGALGVEDGMLIDVGGASTELVVQSKGELLYKKSINVGIVRLKDECGNDKKLLRKVAEERANEFLDAPKGYKAYAIGGTATTLGALSLKLTEYDPLRITGAEITIEQLDALTDKLLSMPAQEIAKLPCVSKGREDVLSGGAVWLSTLLHALGVTSFIVSDRDNLEGYAIKKGIL